MFYAEPKWPYFNDRFNEANFQSLGDGTYSFLDWQESTPYDALSTWGDPQYISNRNLRLNQDNIFPLLSDISIDAVPNDIDGELRSLTNPNYGADEYSPHESNSSASTLLVPLQCGGSREISVHLINTGTENLTSSTINWRINDSLASPFLWTGDLDPEDTAFVYLGEYDLGIENIGFITSWSEMPNGIEDPFTVFDTAHFILKKKYAGHYTVYGEEPDFSDLQTAIDSLEFYGICDSTFLNVRSGEYGVNLHFPYINGVSDSSWVTVQSEALDTSAVTLENDSWQYTILVDSAQFLQFRHLTIQRSDGIINKGCINISNRSKYISIDNNNIFQPAGLDSWTGIVDLTNNSGYPYEIISELSNITITNNRFYSNDAAAIYVRGPSHGSYGIDFIKELYIGNNVFMTPENHTWGLFEGIVNIGSVEKPKIVGNKFFSMRDRAVSVQNYLDTLYFTHNSIFSHGASSGVVSFTPYIEDNFTFIANNEISSLVVDFAGTGGGISFSNVNNGLVVNNSFLSIDNIQPILMIKESSITIKNNQLICFNGILASHSYPIRIIDDLGCNLDFNQYYYEDKLGLIEGEIITDLPSMYSEFEFDGHSIFGDPEFLNDTTLLSTNTINIDQGENLAQVADDILGNPRGLSNDIGAYEIDDYDLNLTILAIKTVPIACGDSLEIFIDFKNSGIVDINNFDISIEGDGILPGSFEWLGTIEHFDVVNDYFLMTTPAIDLPTDISVILSDPNDDLDEYLLDNSLVIAYDYADSIVAHYFEICEGDSVLVDDTYIFVEGIYNETLITDEGCDSLVEVTVEFITVNAAINYEAGALAALETGISYQWVNCDTDFSPIEDEIYQEFTPSINGNYAVIVEQFGCRDTSDCYSVFDVGIQTEDFSQLKVYPNPTTDKIWVDFGSEQSNIIITLYSSDGKLIYNKTNQFIEKIAIDLEVAAGIYFLNIKNLEGESRLFKVLKQ